MGMDIGILGFGTMAENLILNLNSKNKKIAIHNRTIEKVEHFVNLNAMNKAAKDYECLVSLLVKPRVIIVLLPAGKLMDTVLLKFDVLLDDDDIVIDMGNSCYKDTTRRVKEHRYLFVGCGISGGNMGARYGASLMPGGNQKAWSTVKEIFSMIAAKHCDSLCFRWLGPEGSGHLVKTIHNGIEYGNMAIISEIASLKTREKASELFESWNNTHDSFLLNIASIVLKNPKIDKIEDISHNKGTGVWSSVISLENQVCSNIITEAVFARIMSKEKETRILLDKNKIKGENPIDISDDDLKASFDLSVILSYIQGLHLIKKVSDFHNWNLNLSDILEIWKNGSIIKSRQLDTLQKMLPLLEVSEDFVAFYEKNIVGLRRTVSTATLGGFAIPTLSAAVNCIHSLSTKDGNGKIIQAMRDFFGSHLVRFVGDNEDVHVEWSDLD